MLLVIAALTSTLPASRVRAVAEVTEGPSTQPPNQPPNDGPSLRLVLGVVAVLTVLFGVLGYARYAGSERWVAEGITEMKIEGETLDVEGCIDATVEWYDACDEHDANAAVCLQGVGIVIFHCLAAQDRSQTCEQYLDPDSQVHEATEDMRERARNPAKAGESGRWVYGRCEERGMRCVNKRECACAEAYRAVDSFCRTGQQAVQL